MKYEKEIIQDQNILNLECPTKNIIIQASGIEELVKEPSDGPRSDTFYVGNIKVSTFAPVEWGVLAKL